MPASLIDATPRGVARDFGSPVSERRAVPLEVLLLACVTAAAVLVYGLLHRQLALQLNAAMAREIPGAASQHPGRDAVTWSFGPFLAVLFGSVGLAALRHRLAAFSIFVLTAMTPLVQAGLGVVPADHVANYGSGPNPLGAYWTGWRSVAHGGELWRASAVDYGLALLPALAIAAWTICAESRVSEARPLADAIARLRMPTTSEAAGFVCSAFLFWLVLHTWELRQAETLETSGWNIGADVVAYLPFFALGVVLARGSLWRFAVLAGAPILWSTLWIPRLFAGDIRGLELHDAHDTLPFVAVVAAGALWRPIASVLNREHARAWVLVIGLNALNLADVLFTSAAVHSGQAAEANPAAAWIGPEAKLVGVGIASALLARFRPRALVALVLVLALVVAWHLSGLALDSA